MRYIDELCERRDVLKNIKEDIVKAYETIKDTYRNDKKLFICGNGGSAADSSHITGELMKGFKKNRIIDDRFCEKLKETIEDYMDKNKNVDARLKFNEMQNNLEVGLPTIDVTSFTALNTAFANDKNFLYAYANVILGLGKKGDALLSISTSGNSENIVNTTLVARALGMRTIALSGFNGGKLFDIADVSIVVPINETYLVQEEHIAIYHAICLDLEEEFF